MKSTFGKKLFRFFLLFAFIPSIVITVTTYWLTVGVIDLLDNPTNTPTNQISAYYTNFLNDCMIRAIDLNDSSLVDFIITDCKGTKEIRFSRSDSISALVPKIFAQFGEREQGYVDIDGLLIQLVTTIDSDSCRTFAGLVHDENLSEMLASVEPEQAQVASMKDLRIQIGSFLLVALVIVGIVMMLAAYFFSARYASNLSKPIALLSSASKDVAGGNFERQVAYHSSGELQVLIDSFNEMTSRLRSTTERLSQTERVAAWRSIARRFAHDLKNPLQPISISLYRIRQQAEKSNLIEKLEEPLRAAEEELKQLTKLANRFSDLSQIPPPDFAQVDMNALLTSLADLYADETNDRHINFNLPDIVVKTSTDQTYLREVFHNLIKNAIEATPADGTIDIILTAENDSVQIVVRDNGQGMDSATMRDATQPYFTTKKSGSGLGLAVAEKTIIELGGQMKVESKIGHGTTITISLPLKDSNGPTNSHS